MKPSASKSISPHRSVLSKWCWEADGRARKQSNPRQDHAATVDRIGRQPHAHAHFIFWLPAWLSARAWSTSLLWRQTQGHVRHESCTAAQARRAAGSSGVLVNDALPVAIEQHPRLYDVVQRIQQVPDLTAHGDNPGAASTSSHRRGAPALVATKHGNGDHVTHATLCASLGLRAAVGVCALVWKQLWQTN